MTIQLRQPEYLELLETAKFSYENFVSQMASSSGDSVLELSKSLGGPPTHFSDNDLWFLVERGCQKIGFVWIQVDPKSKTAFGYDIYLDPPFRSRGIGRKVMRECGKILMALGIKSIQICVLENNKAARALYDSLGFEVSQYAPKKRQFTPSLNLNNLDD